MNKTTETIEIDGMSCGHCVDSVKRALEETEGVEVCEVNIGSARVSYDPDTVQRATITQAIEDVGFEVKENA